LSRLFPESAALVYQQKQIEASSVVMQCTENLNEAVLAERKRRSKKKEGEIGVLRQRPRREWVSMRGKLLYGNERNDALDFIYGVLPVAIYSSNSFILFISTHDFLKMYKNDESIHSCWAFQRVSLEYTAARSKMLRILFCKSHEAIYA
jgi:hypothetical protein